MNVRYAQSWHLGLGFGFVTPRKVASSSARQWVGSDDNLFLLKASGWHWGEWGSFEFLSKQSVSRQMVCRTKSEWHAKNFLYTATIKRVSWYIYLDEIVMARKSHPSKELSCGPETDLEGSSKPWPDPLLTWRTRMLVKLSNLGSQH